MKEVTIYEFQLKAIFEALRITSRIHKCNDKVTSHDRQVTQALQFARNALNGKKDTEVPYH